MGRLNSTIKALDKALDMTRAARMKRARELNYNTTAYSGSTHNIEAFDGNRANPESDWGRGTYATNSPVDASDNYAGMGPDLTQRVQLESERVADELYDLPEYDLADALADVGLTPQDYEADEAAAALAIARRRLVGDSEGVVYPLRLRTEKYARIGGDDATRLTQPDYYDTARKEIDPAEYADETEWEDAVQERAYELQANDMDSLENRVYTALQNTDMGQDDMALQSVMESIQEDILDGDLSLTDLDAAIRNNVTEAYDEMGEILSPGEISRQALESLGYEGVIDNTVDLKFGTNRRGFGGARVPGMSGVTPDTQHIVTFPGYERNIRSEFAAFDPAKADSPNLLAGGAAAAVGLGAATGSEDSEAGVITRGGKRMLEFWHGSPHKFDQFDMSKIGTGEGAQAYGHGLYGADSRDVAVEYRRMGRPKNAYISPDGDGWRVRGKNRAGGDFDLGWFASQEEADAALDAHNGAIYRVEADIDPDMLLDWDKPLSEQPRVLDALNDAMGMNADAKSYWSDSLLEDLAENGPSGYPDDRLERVVDAYIKYGEYSDEFGPSIVDELREAAPNLADEFMDVVQSQTAGGISPDDTAESAYRLMQSAFGPDGARERFLNAGIPGIRYLDGMSRNAGEGSYNYVMFDDKPLRIVERGNINPTLLASMGGVSALTVAASEFQQRREQKRGQWEALRKDLLNAVNQAVEAIDMPWRGYLGLSRLGGGLLAGESFDQALNAGATQATQPLERTAYELGGEVTDATGSPLAGTVVNTAVNVGGPI